MASTAALSTMDLGIMTPHAKANGKNGQMGPILVSPWLFRCPLYLEEVHKREFITSHDTQGHTSMGQAGSKHRKQSGSGCDPFCTLGLDLYISLRRP